MFSKAKASLAINRLSEEQLFEQALQEVESGNIRKGLMAKAISESEGDTAKAEALYLKLRVQSIIDEGKVNEVLIEESAKAYSNNEKVKTEIKKTGEKAAKEEKARLERIKKREEKFQSEQKHKGGLPLPFFIMAVLIVLAVTAMLTG